MPNSTEEMIRKMGFNPEELVVQDQKLTKSRRRSPYVCSCGHPISSHHSADGLTQCRPSRMECHCKFEFPVLYTDDNRKFLRKTNSYGAEHALMRGLAACFASGVTCSWLKGEYINCASCHKDNSNEDLSPALLEFDGSNVNGTLVKNYKFRSRVSNNIEYERNLKDVMLCPECLDDYILGKK